MSPQGFGTVKKNQRLLNIFLAMGSPTVLNITNMVEGKVISITPDAGLYRKVSDAAEQLRMSRTGFCEMSLEFVLAQMKKGDLVQVNGRLAGKGGEKQP